MIPLVFAIVVGEVGQIECEVEARQELLEIAGKTGINGVALHVDETRALGNTE